MHINVGSDLFFFTLEIRFCTTEIVRVSIPTIGEDHFFEIIISKDDITRVRPSIVDKP